MGSHFHSLTVELPLSLSEAAQGILHEAGALGLEVRDGPAGAMPGVRLPSPGQALLIAYYDGEPAAEGARGALLALAPGARCEVARVEEQDWSTSWRSLIRSTQVGRLWVGPPWERESAPAGLVHVVVEPKMAFGTGDHPTTRLCLEAVDAYLAAHPQAAVLDVGTGTGVLAIAARKLGARHVVATDNDPVAVELARECAEENGAEVDLSTRPLEAVSGRFDLVLANILANTLVELAPRLAPRVGDRLFLAGILAGQEDEVRAAYLREGLRSGPDRQDGEWVRLELFRPGAAG